MAAFLSNQLDFIFFFYGLAFILLGVTCRAIARSKAHGEAWAMLGLFGFVHGLSEWLDLSALILGDRAEFAALRTAVMTASYVFLLEFARLDGIRLGMKLPGRWIYVPLVMLVVLVGVVGGVRAAGITSRYAIGFVGSLGAGAALASHASALWGGARRFALSASAGFVLYAIAAGLVVPVAPFWPASVFNTSVFASLTGMPIQLARGVLACCISFSIWAVWGEQQAAQASSARYTAYMRQQYIRMLVAMATILVSGWTLTEFLGGIYRNSVQEGARVDIDLLASRLAGDTATIDGMVKSLAGSPSVLPLLTGGNRDADEIARSVLDLDTEASGAKRGYILDRSGKVLASSNRRESLPGATDHGAARYFRTSIDGGAGYEFAFDASSGARDYYASQPIRAGDGRIIGVAVLVKSLDAFEAELRQFDRPYFFVDPDGLVVMTNRPEALLRILWPLAADNLSSPAREFGRLQDGPMLDREIVDGTWTSVDNERNYVRRRLADHSQWSLVILKPTREIFATRLLGIVITFLVTIMALIYLFGSERWVHDAVQADNRVRLQALTQDLGVKATTDPLTGLHNRLKLESTLPAEMARADRYDTPLSLVLYDVDHFKKVNDTYGHPVGDKVLIQLSRFVPNLIRNTDFLARWGGEEFLILVPGSDGAMAFQAAEKLREAISHVVFDEVGSITCSFGVAEYIPGESVADLITRADDALYRAKADGRNQVQMMPRPTRHAA